jgi:bidirectional [NiFe] hydrogenase diaphorase subunit
MTPEELRQSAEAERQKSHACKHILGVCCAAGCQSMGSDKIKDALDKQVRLKGMESEVNVKSVGCLGLCAAGPLVSLESNGKKACNADEGDPGAFMDRSVLESDPHRVSRA